MNIVRQKKGIEMAKIFGKDLNFTCVGYPSDMQYFNLGVTKVHRLLKYFPASLIIIFLAIFYFWSMFHVCQILQNRHEFFPKEETCSWITDEFDGIELTFREDVLNDLNQIENGGKGYGLSLKLIADDYHLLKKLRNEFSCFCE